MGLAGPILAFLVTWLPPVAMVRSDLWTVPTQHQLERLRGTPSDAVLVDLRSHAVWAYGFYGLAPAEIQRIADRVLSGHLELPGLSFAVDVPFRPNADVLGYSSREFLLCRFIVASVLAQAYSVTGETQYLDAAVRYVLDWSRFEAGLWLPRGYVLNDHAVSERAVVVTEIWRLYRSSEIFQPATGADLIAYVRRLAGVLRKPELYTYWTNHGLMQSLSLLHLAVAFPSLPEAELNSQVGVKRVLEQVPYFINEEGVVLENSAGYHESGLNILAASQRYFALLGASVPADLVDRAWRGMQFYAALRRPDGTLPPFGDTQEDPSSPPRMIMAGYDSAALAPRKSVTVAPAAGYAVLWRNLERWPDVAELSQAIMNWGNFPTNVHKHADDLAVSLWAGGVQWIRSVGYWPYDDPRLRESATGWRGSSAPHWVGEGSGIERSAALLGSVLAGQTNFLDVERRDAAGSAIRRQVLQVRRGIWATVDSFGSKVPREAEIIWHFSPSVVLRPLGPRVFRLTSPGAPVAMVVSFDGSAGWKVQADQSGVATWNSGVISAGRITRAPAVRLTASGKDPVLLSVFELQEATAADGTGAAVGLRWRGPEQWKISMSGSSPGAVMFGRLGDRLSVSRSGPTTETWPIIDESERAETIRADRSARAAFEDAVYRHGKRFEPMLERRVKVTAVVAACGLVQIALFTLTRRRAWWRLLFVTSSASWIALAAFLYLSFVA